MDLKKILDSLVPFIVFGFGIALCVGLLFMFFSVAIWGVVIGAVLWISSLIKNYLCPSKSEKSNDEGRIIEHDNRK
jgi:hypothetical protein